MIHSREITSKILSNLASHEIVLLIGTRQTGKTTLTKLIAENSGLAKENIFYYDLEDKMYREMFNIENIGAEILKNILKMEGFLLTEKNLLIFDEIQLLNDPSNVLKLLHDHFPTIKIIATGSSSLQIKHKFTDSLAGRKQTFIIDPLNFDEFLVFKGQEKLKNIRAIFNEEGFSATEQFISARHTQFQNLFEEYITFGGYPEVVLTDGKNEKIEKLASISNAYIQKDIRDFAKIENISAYNNVLKYLAINSGNLTNIATIANTIGIAKSTTEKYISLLQETFIIDKLPPFFSNKTKEIIKNAKIYFKDNGIRNLQLMNFQNPELRTDKGILYENYVFNSLENNKNILSQNYFYRTQTQTEIDFISRTESQLTLIEVKASDFYNQVKSFSGFEETYSRNFQIIKKIIINKSNLTRVKNTDFIPAYLF